MRALFSWDADPRDPNYHQIVIALGSCLPAGKVRAITPHAAILERTDIPEVNATMLHLQQVVNQFAGQVVVVLAAQDDADLMWVCPAAPPGPPLVAIAGDIP